MALPDFLIVGAPKAGTSALHEALGRHPQVYTSGRKEPKFFLTDGRPPTPSPGPGDEQVLAGYVWDRAAYERIFDRASAGTQVRGESTPFYLSDPAALRRIRAVLPEVRLIALLRDPVARAYANWAHLYADAREPEPDFLRACRLEEQRLAAGWEPFWGYLRLGRYGSQLDEVYRLFRREQLLVLTHEQLTHHPAESLRTVLAFLGVDPDVPLELPTTGATTMPTVNAWTRLVLRGIRSRSAARRWIPPAVRERLVQRLRHGRLPSPRVGPRIRAALEPVFAPELDLAERLTGLPVTRWLRGDLAVPVDWTEVD
jgi:hypothetical protein